jgi:hypothetical protein
MGAGVAEERRLSRWFKAATSWQTPRPSRHAPGGEGGDGDPVSHRLERGLWELGEDGELPNRQPRLFSHRPSPNGAGYRRAPHPEGLKMWVHIPLNGPPGYDVPPLAVSPPDT